MTPSPRSRLSRFDLALPIAGLLFLLGVAGWAYSLAFSGAWQFDDEPNLQGLSQVEDFSTALEFTMSGIAGPTGRPVSLATFALQAQHWPERPEKFRHINTAIHLANILLVFFIALMLVQVLHPNDKRSLWLALCVAALWGLSSFLATGAFMVIQRMALLSGFFVFLGLIFFMIGRIQSEQHPTRGIIFMIAGIGGGTLLATLSKENGILLPMLALVIEIVFFRQRLQRSHEKLRPWLFCVLVVPSLAVVAFLIQRTWTQAGYFLREFSMLERVLTQPRVLWDYVVNLFLPSQSSVTPFTDNFPISESLLTPQTTLFSIVALGAVIAAAIHFRRTAPVLTFAIGWFLAGHVLESTVISLEIYFAHRNYVAAFGLFFGVVYALLFSDLFTSTRSIVVWGLAFYIALFGVVLADAAKLWGSPELSAEVWYLNDESSSRAAQFLAKTYENQNDPAAADEVIQKTRSLNPDHVWLALRSLDYCDVSEQEYSDRLGDALQALSNSSAITFFDIKALHYLAVNRLESDTCSKLTGDRFLPLLQAAERDLTTRGTTESRHRLAYAKAWYHQTMNEPLQAIESYQNALKIYRDPETVVIIAQLFWDIEERERAFEILTTNLNSPPARPFAEPAWTDRLSEFIEILKARETANNNSRL